VTRRGGRRPPFGLSWRRIVSIAGVLLATGLAGALALGGGPDLAVFLISTVALAGLAWLVSLATESVGERFGPAVTGVLQSSLGNLPELFVVFFALKAGELVVAQTSILGSIFANALLVLGAVIVVGSRRGTGRMMRFHPRLPKDTSTLLLMAVFIITLLGLAVQTGDRAAKHDVTISAIGAVALIGVYITWLIRYVRDDPAASSKTPDASGEGAAAAGAGAIPFPVAIVLLVVAAIGAVFVADWFVGALDPAIEALHLSKPFAGLVIVAIAGNAVENVSSVVLASKGKSELAISVVKNSVSQVAVLLFPVLVLLSLTLPTKLVLEVSPVYLGALVLTALAVWQITGDGEAYTFEGLALMAMYVILAVVAYFE
jgi:Ca2+:H+ antiporter